MKIVKKFGLFMMIFAMVFAFVGCKAESEDETTESTTAKETESTTAKATEATEATEAVLELEGTLALNGSTSVEKIGRALADEFMAYYPDVTITYEATGSSAGIKAAGEKTADIGTASREIKDQERTDYGMDEIVMAFDGIAVIVHPSNGIANLTEAQVTAIFKGEITNWKDVGGADGDIVVVSREESSGTRGAFEELLEFQDALTADAMVVEGNGGVQTTVGGNENSIGYVSFASLDDSVKAIDVEGVTPTVENVLNKTYPVSRPFMMVYFEDSLSDIGNAFVEFAMSEEGQAIVEENGAIPVQ